MKVMNKYRKIFTTILLVAVSTALYLYFMAPIGKHITTGIPYTSYYYGGQIPQDGYQEITTELIQGDHLQLQYHFDLFSKMLNGDIPAFHNLYEFNTGSDAERKIIDPYYIPFSFTYTIAQYFSTDAFAWNFSQLLSALCSLVFLYLLVRRFTSKETLQITCLAIAVIAITVPYRWINLAAGSPTGFGMGLVPGVFLGIDIAIRDKRIKGGILAAILTFLLYCTDLHCFVFSILATPIFCIISWIFKATKAKDLLPSWKEFWCLTKNLIAIPIAGLCAMYFALKLRASYATTDVAGGRTLDELRVNSPVLDSLVDYAHPSHSAMHFNIGWTLTILIIASTIIALFTITYYYIKSRKKTISTLTDTEKLELSKKRFIAFTAFLFCITIFGIIILALGTNGPFDGLGLRAIRKILPPYQMIRQPVKIFCLLPTLIAPLLIIIWNLFNSKQKMYQHCKGMILFAVVLLSLTVAREGMWCGISLLPEQKQSAYQEVVNASKSINKTPRALILPIWPGDSSWSSIYEYHAIRNDLRMLNGYSPVKSFDYLDDVFYRYETFTQGYISNDDLATLKEKHLATAIIIHENAFPDKVSPLPVGYTLKQFLNNSNLQFLKQDRDAWSFSIYPSTNCTQYTIISEIPQTLCPSHIKHFDKRSNGVGLIPETFNKKGTIQELLRKPLADASNGQVWLPLEEEMKISSQWLDCTYLTNNYHRAGMWVAHTPNPEKLIFVSDGIETPGVSLLDKNGQKLPLAIAPIGSSSYSTNGFVDLKIKGSSPIHSIAYMPILDIIDPRNEPRKISATDLFHAGYTSTTIDNEKKTISFDSVVLEPNHAPVGNVIYGPNLPIIGGTWQVELEFTNDSSKIGSICVYTNGQKIAKGPADKPLKFTADNCSFVCIYYEYPQTDKTVLIKAITLAKPK